MKRRLIAVVVLGVMLAGGVLTGCGAAPKYTARQAVIDMAAYIHDFNGQAEEYDNCIVQYLFHGWAPDQVKIMIQSADFGEFGTSNAVLAQAKYACRQVLPSSGGCHDGAAAGVTAPSSPPSSSIVTNGGTVYLNLNSAREQVFTGSKPQTVVLPNPASLILGDQFHFTNKSSGALTVEAIDYRKVPEVVAAVAPKSSGVITCAYATVPAWSTIRP